jgi:isopentenyl diphosphate isomerase/L-lactate dehydrogenase-like FMN-dependent dehydrogenase
MMLSINTSVPVAQVAPAAQGTLWGQFYPVENLANTQKLIDAYNNAGVVNLFPTVDQQASYYERTQQDANFGGQVRGAGRGARGGGGATAPTGSQRYRINGGRLWYTWEYIDAVRKMTKGKMLIKGILEPADALLAIEHGVDAIIVSNHGGRSMDYGPSTLEVLPEIVAAVNGKVPIVFDSGIRRGSDIFKALALGANAVMIGRTTRWGLAAYGIPGAQRVIEMLQQELVQVAAAAGCAKLSDINKATVKANFV